jgi:hypothetical protein
MANITLGHPNLFDQGNLSGGIWTAGLPLAHLQFRQLGRVARTEDATLEATQFVVDFLSRKTFRVLALVNHSISFAGRWIVEASDDIEFDTIIYTATMDAWASLAGARWVASELSWRSNNFWRGTVSKEDAEGLTPIAFHIAPADIQARYLRIRIIDTTNADGYVQIGRVFVGPAWTPTVNYSYGGSLAYEDPTTVDTSLGGAEYFDERSPYRVMRFTLGFLDEKTEGFAKALDIVRRAGISGEILVIPDPDDKDNGQRRNFMGRLRQLSPLEQAMFQLNSMAFEIKELK